MRRISFQRDEDSYTDYSVTLTYTFMGVDLSVAWVGTDLDTDDCFNDADACDDTAVFQHRQELLIAAFCTESARSLAGSQTGDFYETDYGHC